MTVIIGSDVDGKRLKEVVKAFLKENNHEVVDVTEGKDVDFVDSTLAIAQVQKNDENLGIAIDAFGAGSFMVATKVKGMIARSFRRKICLHDTWSQ